MVVLLGSLLLGVPGALPSAGCRSPSGGVTAPSDGGSSSLAGNDARPDRDGDAGASDVTSATLPPRARGVDDGCPAIFTQETVRRYDLQITPDVWNQLMSDFAAGPPPAGAANPNYYPVVSLTLEGETRTDAMIRLKGDRSWTFALGDPKPKAQFLVAFDQGATKVPFHGVNQIDFDMSDYDRTMLNERVAYAFMRAAGLPAPCANNAELYINGANYGLYTSEERYGKPLLARLFPGQSGGVLLASGRTVETNPSAENTARVNALWAAHDVASMRAAHVDLTDSLRAWAAEAIVNDADGYWGGDHNFFIYDHPQVGFLWLSDDLDSAFAWIGSMQPPVYWWAGRYWTPSVLPQHYLAVIGDPQGRAAFVAAIAEMFDRYDVAALQGWIDAWSAQIAPAVSRDAHLPFTPATHDLAVAAMRAEVAQRAAYLADFLSCEKVGGGGGNGGGGGGGGGDLDGDGYPWCNDCDDSRSDVHPGAPEICGDGVDQNCDSVADDGCPR
jgi:hypothetical protein